MAEHKKGYPHWNIFFSTLAGDITFAFCTIIAITDLLASPGGTWHWFGAICWIVMGKTMTDIAADGRIDAAIERAFRERNLDKDDYEDWKKSIRNSMR